GGGHVRPERVHLDPLVGDALLGERQARDPEIDAILVAVQDDRHTGISADRSSVRKLGETCPASASGTSCSSSWWSWCCSRTSAPGGGGAALSRKSCEAGSAGRRFPEARKPGHACISRASPL